jgi:hypothetical protein
MTVSPRSGPITSLFSSREAYLCFYLARQTSFSLAVNLRSSIDSKSLLRGGSHEILDVVGIGWGSSNELDGSSFVLPRRVSKRTSKVSQVKLALGVYLHSGSVVLI